MEDNDEIRLSKYLSTAGISSRRAAGELVTAGRVTVNGVTSLNPGMRVHPGDRVCLDGKPIVPGGEKHYIMLNKPRGYVCTNADRHAPRKAVDLIKLPGAVRLFSAGRLDKDSEGMLIISNDGDFVERLSHPSHEILKTYSVRLTRELSYAELAKIRNGIKDAGETLRVRSVSAKGQCRYEFVLNEGRKREIRRIAAAVGAPVVRLRRFRIGKLELGALPPGKYRELNAAERELLLAGS